MAKNSRRGGGAGRTVGSDLRPAGDVAPRGVPAHSTPQKTRPGPSIALVKRGALGARPITTPTPTNGGSAAAVGRPRRQRETSGLRHPQIAERIASATEELASGISEAAAAADQLRKAMEQISAGAEESAGAAQESLAAVAEISVAFVQAR